MCLATPSTPSRTIASGVRGLRQQRLGGAVDRDVGRLRRQHDGNQQRERIDEGQLAARIGVGLGQRLEEAAHLVAASWCVACAVSPWLGEVLSAWQRLSRAHVRAARVCQRRGPATWSGVDREATLFEAVIVPHRSLSPRGLRDPDGGDQPAVRADGAALLVDRRLAGGGVRCGGDRPGDLPAAAERQPGARQRTDTAVGKTTLRIVRTDRRGRRKEHALSVGWLNVALEEPPGQVPRLVLVARGVREEIATTLGEAEKRDLWTALRDALHRAAQPELR